MKAQSFHLTVSMVMVMVWFTLQLYLQTITDTKDVAIQLVENTTLYSGIIELRIRVCHVKWTDENAQVACRSMGLPFTGKLCNFVLDLCKGASSLTFSRDRVIQKSSVIRCTVSFACTSVNSCQLVTCSTTFLASDNHFTASNSYNKYRQSLHIMFCSYMATTHLWRWERATTFSPSAF